MPFYAEQMYQQLKTEEMPESVHLCDWPGKKHASQTNLDLEQKMDEVRNVVTLALAKRAEKAIKVRQPVASLTIKNKNSKIKKAIELLDLIKDEVNVKEVVFSAEGGPASGWNDGKEVELDTVITLKLKEEGMMRDLVRAIQDLRKEQGLKPEDRINVRFFAKEAMIKMLEKNSEFLLKETRAEKYIAQKDRSTINGARPSTQNIECSGFPEELVKKEMSIDNQEIILAIEKLPVKSLKF